MSRGWSAGEVRTRSAGCGTNLQQVCMTCDEIAGIDLCFSIDRRHRGEQFADAAFAIVGRLLATQIIRGEGLTRLAQRAAAKIHSLSIMLDANDRVQAVSWRIERKETEQQRCAGSGMSNQFEAYQEDR